MKEKESGNSATVFDVHRDLDARSKTREHEKNLRSDCERLRSGVVGASKNWVKLGWENLMVNDSNLYIRWPPLASRYSKKFVATRAPSQEKLTELFEEISDRARSKWRLFRNEQWKRWKSSRMGVLFIRVAKRRLQTNMWIFLKSLCSRFSLRRRDGPENSEGCRTTPPSPPSEHTKNTAFHNFFAEFGLCSSCYDNSFEIFGENMLNNIAWFCFLMWGLVSFSFAVSGERNVIIFGNFSSKGSRLFSTSFIRLCQHSNMQVSKYGPWHFGASQDL